MTGYAAASRAAWRWSLLALLVSLTLSVAFCFTRAPFWDEGLFADAALNLRDQGHLGNTVLDPYGHLELPGVHRYTYWQFPLYLVTLSLWTRLVPATIEGMRMLSVLWEILYVAAWFLFVRCLGRNETLALLVASLVALDYSTVQAASTARMEIMAAALGMCGMASYVCLRESSWTQAILLAACCGAAALFCHPMGLGVNAQLAVVVLASGKINWKRLPVAALPYLFGGVLCVWYASQAPDIFLAQMHSAAAYRVNGLGALARRWVTDISERYVYYYWTDLAGLTKLKAASLLFPLGGALALALDRNARSLPGARTLLLMAITAYSAVALIDNQYGPIHFIYSLPIFTACGAFWVWHRWQTGGAWSYVASIMVTAAVLSTIGGYSMKIRRNDFHNQYQPAVAAIRRFLPPGGIVMGGSELGFALGFAPPLIDDRFLGFSSGKSPDVFARNVYYYATPPPAGQLPGAWNYVVKTIPEKYHLVFQNTLYNIYIKK